MSIISAIITHGYSNKYKCLLFVFMNMVCMIKRQTFIMINGAFFPDTFYNDCINVGSVWYVYFLKLNDIYLVVRVYTNISVLVLWTG